MIRYFLITASTLLSLNGYSQSIDWSKPNTDLLTRNIIKHVNVLRTKEHLAPFKVDSVLSLAAQNQALFCARTQRVRHDQPEPKLATARKRVEFYNGTYKTIGENAASFSVNVPTRFKWDTGDTLVTIDSYEKAAEWFVHVWRLSPVHNTNLMYPRVDLSGLGFAFDAKNQVFYAVNVLGRK